MCPSPQVITTVCGWPASGSANVPINVVVPFSRIDAADSVRVPSCGALRGSHASPMASPSKSDCVGLAATGQLSLPSATPSLSSSASQASPCASPSVLAWSGLARAEQLSLASATRVVVVVGVADVALRVAVVVGLVGVGRQRAVVGAVGDGVVVVVGVAGIALRVAVVVRPGRRSPPAGSCRHRRRRCRCRRRGRRRRPARRRRCWPDRCSRSSGQLSLAVVDGVVVVVGVAGITLGVAVVVRLIGVGGQRAVVVRRRRRVSLSSSGSQASPCASPSLLA